MKTWDMVKTVYTVGDFISWQKNKTLVLSPSFQRRPVWTSGAKSFLIDTIMRGLPIPIIFLRDQKTDLTSLESKKEVVDGQQRVRTLVTYIASKFLPDFKKERDQFVVQKVHNPEIADKPFAELPEDARQRILDYQFSVHILPSSVDDREVLQIFARMNSTGVKLNDQELRNAEYFGEFKTSVYELASEQLARWRGWKIFTEYNIARMDEVELTSEFSMLMLRGVTGKTQPAITRAYKEKDLLFPEREEVERRFRQVMESIEDKFGDDVRFTPFKKKTLFYSLFAVIYDFLYSGKPLSVKAKADIIAAEDVARIKKAGDSIQNKAAPADVLEAVARRTTHPGSRTTVIRYLKTLT